MILVALIAGHIGCGIISFIIEKDILRNTLLIKTELEDEKRDYYISKDHTPSRRRFSRHFKISKIKHGFCVSRHKYTLNIIITKFIVGILGGFVSLTNSLLNMTNILSIQDSIIVDDYDDAVVLYGEKYMSELQHTWKLDYNVHYLPFEDIQVYTKSSIVYKVFAIWSEVKCAYGYFRDKMKHIVTMMNVQR